MLIKEKKYKKEELTKGTNTKNKNNNNFIVLDDRTESITKGIKDVFKSINSYGYNVDVIDIRDSAKEILEDLKTKEFDTLLTVGEGGRTVLSSIKNNSFIKQKELILLNWSRSWNKDKSLGFETNIDDYNFKDKRIIILEDVIASGNTLYTLVKEIEKRGGKVEWIYSSLIQESSPLIKKSFCNMTSITVIKKPKDKDLDPFWYPPIYSLRHLIRGDEEMPEIYNVLNEKYFNNEDKVEKLIKRIRK